MKTFVLLLTLALFATTSVEAVANSAVQPAAVSFTGTWKTIAGGTNEYTVVLKQIDKQVTGSYSPGNGKILEGVVTDNKLTFKWTQDGGYEGTGEFTMDEDGKGFTGSSTALKPKEFTVTWNTYKPPVISFAGTWETITNGKHHFDLTMVQTGTKVTGVYPRGNGKIEGTVEGRVLRFKWESDGGTGSGRFVMEESAQAFNGTYNKGDNPDDVDATWNGKRPAVSADKAPKADKSPEKATPPQVSFTGVWNTMMVLDTALGTGKQIEVTLRQTGDRVTGTYMPGDGSIKNAVVTGRVLRFQWTQEDGLSGSGRFEMGADGTSISGSWNPSKDPDAAGTPWNGTLKPLSFTGVWDTMLSTGKAIEISLRQTGDKVTGTYMPGNAQIKDGVVTGFELRFQWTQEDGLSGSGRLEMVNSNGTSIDGIWIPSKDPNAAGTSWYGSLKPVSLFAGAWHAKLGEAFMELIFQQAGDQVTGQLNINSVIYVIREGTVVGNTLRFKIVRPRTVSGVIVFDHVLGIGELVMDAGGKSFTGNVLGTSTSGTLIRG